MKKDYTREILSYIRGNNKSPLMEAMESEGNPIAITNSPKFGENVLDNQINAFKQAVNGGARFSQPNENDVESSPLVYFPKTGNLVFSGSIPNLSDLKFQFSMNDVTNAPYIFVEGLALTSEVLTILQKLNAFYRNWKEEWLIENDILERLAKENKNNN